MKISVILAQILVCLTIGIHASESLDDDKADSRQLDGPRKTQETKLRKLLKHRKKKGQLKELIHYPAGLQSVKGGIAAPYRNDQRQKEVNARAVKKGASDGTAQYYGVPGSASASYPIGKYPVHYSKLRHRRRKLKNAKKPIRKEDLTSSEINEEVISKPVHNVEEIVHDKNLETQEEKKNGESGKQRNHRRHPKVKPVKSETEKEQLPTGHKFGRFQPETEQLPATKTESNFEPAYTKYPSYSAYTPSPSYSTPYAPNTQASNEAEGGNSNTQNYSPVKYVTPYQLSNMQAPEGYDFAQFPGQPQYTPFYFGETGFPQQPGHNLQLSHQLNPQSTPLNHQVNEQYQPPTSDFNSYNNKDTSGLQHNSKQLEESESLTPVVEPSPYQPSQSLYPNNYLTPQNENTFSQAQPDTYQPSSPSSEGSSPITDPSLAYPNPYNFAKFSPYSNVAIHHQTEPLSPQTDTQNVESLPAQDTNTAQSVHSVPTQDSDNSANLHMTHEMPRYDTSNLHNVHTAPYNTEQYPNNVITEPTHVQNPSGTTYGPSNAGPNQVNELNYTPSNERPNQVNELQYYPRHQVTPNTETQEAQPISLQSTNSQPLQTEISQEPTFKGAPQIPAPKYSSGSYPYYPVTYGVPNVQGAKKSGLYTSFPRQPVYLY